MKNTKYITAILLVLAIFTIAFSISVSAQSAVGQVGEVNLNVDERIGLQTISIPYFDQIAIPGDEYSTTLSWLSFIGSVASIAIVAFWIVLVLRAAFSALQAEGEPEQMAESFKKLRSVFIGAAIAIAFPIGLSLIGFFFGLGPLWTWPAAFRDCPNSTNRYYYQEVLDQERSGAADAVTAANQACF